jgi:hypothetical protein
MRHSDGPLGANGKSYALLPLGEWGSMGGRAHATVIAPPPAPDRSPVWNSTVRECRGADYTDIDALRYTKFLMILAACPHAICARSY